MGWAPLGKPLSPGPPIHGGRPVYPAWPWARRGLGAARPVWGPHCCLPGPHLPELGAGPQPARCSPCSRLPFLLSPLLVKDRAPPKCPCPAMPPWTCRRGGKSPAEQACSPGMCSSCWASETRVPRHPERPVLPGGEVPDRITAGSGAGVLLGPLCISTSASGSGLQLLCPPLSPLQPPGCRVPRGGSHRETEVRDRGPLP